MSSSSPGTVLEKTVRMRIVSGAYNPDQPIPKEIDLAKEFSVSRATVKRALSSLKREGLLYGIQGKGTYLNAEIVAKNPIQTNTIGVIIGASVDLDHPVMSRRLAGVQTALKGSRFHMKLFSVLPMAEAGLLPTDDWDESLATCRTVAQPGAVDGAIVFCPTVSNYHVRALADRLAVCCTDLPLRMDGVDNVRGDYMRGVCLAARRLLELGHRRIGLITTGEHLTIGRAQVEAMMLSLEFGAGGAKPLIYRANRFCVEEGHAAWRLWNREGMGPTAVICGADDFIPGLWNALREDGLSVPGDVSVVGWNDVITTADVPVALDSIRIDYRQQGRLCGELLLARLEDGGRDAEERILAPEFIVRDSCAPCRDGR